MIKDKPFLTSKSALKTRILIDLAECLQQQGSFTAYEYYFMYAEGSILSWIQHYTVQHCDQCTNGQTRLVYLAIEELSTIILLIAKKVQDVTRNVSKHDQTSSGTMDAKIWLTKFCQEKEIQRKLSLDTSTLHNLSGIDHVNVENFTAEVQKGLNDLQETLKSKFGVMKTDEMNTIPYGIVFERLHGCFEQCPFCGEQCEITDKNHASHHTVLQHRPQCFGSHTFDVDEELVTSICTALVGSKCKFKLQKDKKWCLFKQYNKKYPAWSIPEDLSSEVSLYWKWLLGKYSAEIASRFELQNLDIPAMWTQLKWLDVKKKYTGSSLWR